MSDPTPAAPSSSPAAPSEVPTNPAATPAAPAEAAPAVPASPTNPVPAKSWRDDIQDEELRKHAERFVAPVDVVKNHLELRKKLSTAISIPGKDATPEDIKDYRTKLGVPDAPEGYKYERPKGVELNDSEKAMETAFIQEMHKQGATPAVLKGALDWYHTVTTKLQEQLVQQDKEFAQSTQKALKDEWGIDYDRNVTFANDYLRFAFDKPEDIELAKRLELKSGGFLLDHPLIIKMLVKAGRAFSEDGIGGALPDAQRQSTQQRIDEIHALQFTNPAEYTRLQSELTGLYQKLYGTRPGDGRAM